VAVVEIDEDGTALIEVSEVAMFSEPSEAWPDDSPADDAGTETHYSG